MLERHLVIGRMDAAGMPVRKPGAAADEDFVERPFLS